MKIAKEIKYINVNNMKYLLCFFIFLIFEGLNAQTDTNNKESDLFYKEEIGFLSQIYSGTYNPTGLNAFDTLGLQDINQNIDVYSEQSGVSYSYINIPLYGVTSLTGYTTEITGYNQIPLTGKVYETGAANSGVSFSGISSEDLKKDYIYYLGERL